MCRLKDRLCHPWSRVRFDIAIIKMGRPKKYETEEEKREALRASWRKYNASHRAERAAHNKLYMQRTDVKERLRELRRLRSQQPER